MNADRFELPRAALFIGGLLLQGYRLGLGYDQLENGSDSGALAFVGFATGILVTAGIGYLVVWTRSLPTPDRTGEVGVGLLFLAAVVLMTISELSIRYHEPITEVAEWSWIAAQPVAVLLALSVSGMLELLLFLVARTFPRPLDAGSEAPQVHEESGDYTWFQDEADADEELARMRKKREVIAQVPDEMTQVPCRYKCTFVSKPLPKDKAEAAERGHLRSCPNKPKKKETS